MRDDRILRVLRPSLALAALAAVVVLLGLAIAGPAHAAAASPTPAATKPASVAKPAKPPKPATPSALSPRGIASQGGSDVRFGENVVVPKGTRVPAAVAFGGDILVNGRVTDYVVAFGGDITVNGTVGTSVVAFGGDVRLGPKAVVGRDLKSSDASVILFGGKLTRAPGAQVAGQTKEFQGVHLGDALGWLGRGMLFSPLLGISFFGWIVQTAFFLVLALVAAALMPRQLRGVQRQLGGKPWASLGWGALAFFLVAPAILVVLVISIVGLLLVLPYGLFILLAYFFVTTGVGAFLAQKVLTGFGGKENLMLSVTIGVVGTTVVSRIPAIGPMLLIAMMIFGIGAALLGVSEWRRGRREAAAVQAAANAVVAAAAAGVTAPVGTPAPAVITPMVQTSPAQAAETAPATVGIVAASETRVTGEAAAEKTAATEAVPAVAEAAAGAPEPPAAPAEPEAPAGPPAPEGSPDAGQPAT
jgi:hypothetical protein